jgi:hypothetical protein
MRCLMKNGTATQGNLSREYFVIQINGRTDSIHRRYEDAVRAGLVLKNQFPHFDIKVREGLTDGERVSGMTVTTTPTARMMVAAVRLPDCQTGTRR